MNEENPDWESTTAVFARRAPFWAWLREHSTPAAIWSAIVGLGTIVGALLGAVAYVVHAQVKIANHQDAIVSLQQDGKEWHESLEKINTQLAVMSSKIGDIATEVDRQREWRERIEDVAEAPPHARRKR